MPNHFQVAFLASFVGVFAFLFFLFNFLRNQLLYAGYDIDELILIGLPKDPSVPPRKPTSTKQAMFAQLLALVLAACTSAFIYYKFGMSACLVS